MKNEELKYKNKMLRGMIYRRLWLLTFFILHSSFFILSSCQDKRARDDQGRTSACWIYAMLECVEHEACMRGDSVQLSRQWLMAKELEEQTVWHYLSDGKGADISLRGVGPEALRLIQIYGLVPYQHEKTQITRGSVTERKLQLLARQALSLDDLRERMTDMLPQFTTTRPTTGKQPAFYYLSMRYNPLQFAESVMYYQHWHFYTSVPQQPYNIDIPLAVPDNRYHHAYTNLPIDSITAKVLASLKAGHAVYWEYGNPTPDGIVSSDHAMAIEGIVKSRKHPGRIMLRCKNSYGKEWGQKGYCLISLPYFKAHTCNVGLVE